MLKSENSILGVAQGVLFSRAGFHTFAEQH
jgi:hypothetical protein